MKTLVLSDNKLEVKEINNTLEELHRGSRNTFFAPV